jgi:hypothetical protein
MVNKELAIILNLTLLLIIPLTSSTKHTTTATTKDYIGLGMIDRSSVLSSFKFSVMMEKLCQSWSLRFHNSPGAGVMERSGINMH